MAPVGQEIGLDRSLGHDRNSGGVHGRRHALDLGIDQGREPELDFISRVKLAQSRLKSVFGPAPRPMPVRHASLREAAAAVDSVVLIKAAAPAGVGGKGKGRRGNLKSEVRSSKKLPSQTASYGKGIVRISDFGLLSDFGLRIWGKAHDLTAPAIDSIAHESGHNAGRLLVWMRL